MKRYRKRFKPDAEDEPAACLFEGKHLDKRPNKCDGFSCMYCMNVRNEFAAHFPMMKLPKTIKNETRPETEED
ncbi:MAG: hypothetical protein ACK5Z2_19805 [Bacteroidota bacterium]